MLVTLGLLALLSIKKSTQMTSVQLMLHTYCRNKTQVLEKLGFYSNRATSPDVLHWVCNFFLEKGWEVSKPYTLSILYLFRAEIQLAWHLSKHVSHKTLFPTSCQPLQNLEGHAWVSASMGCGGVCVWPMPSRGYPWPGKTQVLLPTHHSCSQLNVLSRKVEFHGGWGGIKSGFGF